MGMRVVGCTNPTEVFVASSDRSFSLYEYLIIQDEKNNNPIGEIVESYVYPRIEESTFAPSTCISIGLDDISINKNSTVYIGKLRIIEELSTPVASGVACIKPSFGDIEKLLYTTPADKGLLLGVIRGTEALVENIPSEIRGIAPMFSPNKGCGLQSGVPFVLAHYKFQQYPHVAFLGGSGAGKTVAIRNFCEELMKKSLPGVVLDPHYELVFSNPTEGIPDTLRVNFSNKHEVFQVGVNVGINFPELSTDEIISLMEFVSDVSQPMRGAVEVLHEKNDSYVTLIKRVQDLKRAFEYFEKPPKDRPQEELPANLFLLYKKYETSVAGSSTLQAIAWRLEQVEKTGIFNHNVDKIELCILKRKLAIVRGDMRLLKMLSSYLLRKLYRKRRMYKDWEQKNILADNMRNQPQKFPPFFIVMDEAHNFAPNGNYSNPTRVILREISQEARKYGLNLVFGTQRPALLDTTIMAQMNTKIIFRTSIVDDMEMIRRETNLTESQVSRLPSLPSGNAFVSSATLFKTMYIRFKATLTTSPHSAHPFDELDEFNSDDGLKKILVKYLPLKSTELPKYHAKINTESGRNYTPGELYKILDEMVEQGEIEIEKSPMGNRYFPKGGL